MSGGRVAGRERMTISLTKEQGEALSAILSFMQDDEADIFVLRGSAGTGKTTIISEGASKVHCVPTLSRLGAASLASPTSEPVASPKWGPAG